MRAPDDKDVLAAEYVLGTLDLDDRANAQMLKAIDPDFALCIARWERQLGELHALIEPIDPPEGNWEWIEARIADVKPSKPSWLSRPPDLLEIKSVDSLTASPGSKIAAESQARPARRWRRIAVGTGTLALGLAAFGAVREARPQWLPQWLRPAVVERRVEIVREVPSARIADYVAVFDRAGTAPEFILTFDSEKRVLSVRAREGGSRPDGVYTLWIVPPDGAAKILCILDAGDFTVRAGLPALDPLVFTRATFLITRERDGGSEAATPSEPALRARLIQVTPAAFPRGAP